MPPVVLGGIGRTVMVLVRRGAHVVIMVDGGAVRVQVEMGVAVDVGVAMQGRWRRRPRRAERRGWLAARGIASRGRR